MALQGQIPIEFGMVFPHGAYAAGGIEMVRDFDRSSGDLVAALTTLRRRQLEESTIAGTAYGSGVAELGWYRGGEYVIADQAGTPVHPEWYSDEFRRLLRRAGLRRITLHDSLPVSMQACRSRSSASGRVTMTRRSRRRSTSTRARKTCNGASPRSPGSTRSRRAVRKCERPGSTRRIQLLGHLEE
jgi:hypothetical protein